MTNGVGTSILCNSFLQILHLTFFRTEHVEGLWPEIDIVRLTALEPNINHMSYTRNGGFLTGCDPGRCALLRVGVLVPTGLRAEARGGQDAARLKFSNRMRFVCTEVDDSVLISGDFAELILRGIKDFASDGRLPIVKNPSYAGIVTFPSLSELDPR